MLLFHRFLIQERVGKHRRSRDVILTTCLFLAGKVTEAPRRLRDVINVLHMLTSTGHDEPPLLDKVLFLFSESRKSIVRLYLCWCGHLCFWLCSTDKRNPQQVATCFHF